MAHDVFISYSSTDQHAALAVLHGLETAGIRCWMAPRDIKPGAIWAQAIMEGIAECRVLVVVFSANANRSSHVINEVDAAVRKGAIIVPFRIEDVMPDGAMEYHLRTRHWLDALTPDLEQHTARLAEQIRLLLDGQPGTGPTPTEPPRPFPEELRGVRRKPARPSARRRVGWPVLLGLAVVAGGGYWLTRPRAVRDVTFTVKEVSSNGGNETTMRLRSGGLRFFEAGDNIPELAQRSYATAFASGPTRYVDVELKLAYDAPGRDVTVPIGCALAIQSGQVVAAITINAKIQPTWTESYHTQGWGTSEGGWWKPGRYRVECRYGDKLIAREWFTVAAGGAAATPSGPMAEASPLKELHARIKSIKLYESGYDPVPKADRVYRTSFSSASTRYIDVEVTLGYDAPGRVVDASLTCRFLRDRTQPVARLLLDFTIQPTWTDSWTATGWGSRSPGAWTPGNYLVACDDGIRTLGQVGFTVE